MRACAERDYKIPILDAIRPTYRFSESSQGTMPVALAAFFESTSFEHAIRNAGPSAATAIPSPPSRRIAEAYYGFPEEIWEKRKHTWRSVLSAWEGAVTFLRLPLRRKWRILPVRRADNPARKRVQAVPESNTTDKERKRCIAKRKAFLQSDI
jgi:hypothetical protein